MTINDQTKQPLTSEEIRRISAPHFHDRPGLSWFDVDKFIEKILERLKDKGFLLDRPMRHECRMCDKYVKYEGCFEAKICIKGSQFVEAKVVTFWREK